ncbi:MAG: hypothetical protein HN602_09960, partial [Gammaproteobacteria bacterium]|nr:hypothetical protein [Gammaproteobacteria bacterium]
MLNRLLAVFVAILIALPATSLTAAPTDEQIRQFMNLSPAQQAAAKASYLGSNAGSGGGAQPLDTPENVLPIVNQSTSQIEQAAKESTDQVTLAEKKEEKAIKGQLRQFGYDLFAGQATTFAPVSDIPVPSEYVIGPGDTLQIFLFGKENIEHQLQVSREGELNFPGIGPIQVAGMRFDELKSSLNQRIAQQMIGVRASITLGRLRSIRVFILGDVQRPGSYTVSALSTMTNALFVSGGVTKIGSLRNIQLKRQGKVVTTLDLYDLLLKGDTSQDARIQPGDVLFVPPVGEVVGIGGEVRRPALYELEGKKRVDEVIQIAGGLLPTADLRNAQMERINLRGERILVDMDLNQKNTVKQSVQSGDVIKIFSVLDKIEAIVALRGHVQREGGSQWFKGMRLSDLIQSDRDLLTRADLEYLLIKRERTGDKRIEVHVASLIDALNQPGEARDPLLMPRDEIIVLPLGEERSELLNELADQLHLEERYGQPAGVVSIYGNVRFPGEYPYQSSMEISDLVKAAMGVLPKTDMEYALLRREQGEARQLQVSSFALAQVMQQTGNENEHKLKAGDKLIILGLEKEKEKEKGRIALVEELIEEMESQSTLERPAPVVGIGGLVKFPGKYPLEEEMSLGRLVAAAGGFEEAAYTLEAELTHRLIVDGAYRDVSHEVIPLGEIQRGEKPDIALQSYDFLNIRKIPLWDEREFVTIEGEVLFPGTYPVSRGETLYGLMQRAGGVTDYAFV